MTRAPVKAALLAGACAILSSTHGLAAQSQAEIAAVWDAVSARIVAGRSVYVNEGHVTEPLSTSTRRTASPLSTEFLQNAVQDSDLGIMIQGGIVDVLNRPGCAIELAAFLLEPYAPDPGAPVPRITEELRYFVVARPRGAAPRLALSGKIAQQPVANLRAAFNDMGNRSVQVRITAGTQTDVHSIVFDTKAACAR